MNPLDRLDWLRLVMGSPVANPHTKIALAIALRINGKTGECYPSKACLCEDTGMSDASVRRGVLALVNAGLLSVTFSNGRLANRYRLLMAPGNPVTSEVVDATNPVTHDPVTPSNPVIHEGVNHSAHEGVKTPTPSPMKANPFTHDARNKGMNIGKNKELSLSLSQPAESNPQPAAPAPERKLRVVKAVTDWPGFDDFWEAYPDKKAKKDARTAWNKLRPSPEITSAILADLPMRRAQDRRWLDGFIPNPATYLNGERWHDSITPPVITMASGEQHGNRRETSAERFDRLNRLSIEELYGQQTRRQAERVVVGEVLQGYAN